MQKEKSYAEKYRKCDVVNKPMRDRKQQKQDKGHAYDQMEEGVSESAKKAFNHMPRYTVNKYLAGKGVDVKGEISGG